MRVKISTFVPLEDADQVRLAIGKAGAGTIGKYTYCSFTSKGIGRFIPSQDADPHIGEVGKLDEVDEEKIEVVCDRSSASKIIKALKTAHPYEEVAYDIVPLLEEGDL